MLILVFVLLPSFNSSNHRFGSLILFLINPRFLEWLSVKLSFEPLKMGSLDDSVTPLSNWALVSMTIALSLSSTVIIVKPLDR